MIRKFFDVMMEYHDDNKYWLFLLFLSLLDSA